MPNVAPLAVIPSAGSGRLGLRTERSTGLSESLIAFAWPTATGPYVPIANETSDGVTTGAASLPVKRREVASSTGAVSTSTRSEVSTHALTSFSESKRYAPRTVSPTWTSIASPSSTSCVGVVMDAMRRMPRTVPSGACTRSQ